MDTWDADFHARAPLFAPLALLAQSLRGATWPSRERLQSMLDERGVMSGGGLPVRLVPQPARVENFDERYEVRLYRQGELPIRDANWHDFFNLLVWLAFPRAKAALNARHYEAARSQAASGEIGRAHV